MHTTATVHTTAAEHRTQHRTEKQTQPQTQTQTQNEIGTVNVNVAAEGRRTG
ncbi:hypothetical protein [Streptomyces sp. NBC_01429]|uniref:hypothetical protein n=1 Tax=Streptomyces sp. NBC_01429 TaxID=2903862 RepID=UPI002E2A9A75|nr:hypothetical protein [Streptomyces sp. NBC_01429]